MPGAESAGAQGHPARVRHRIYTAGEGVVAGISHQVSLRVQIQSTAPGWGVAQYRSTCQDLSR